MSPDLKSLMNRSAPDPSNRVDIVAVGRRSRGLRRRDRLITLTSTLALGLAVFLFFSFVQPGDESSEQENDRSQVVNPAPEESESEAETSLDNRAATFAIKALAESRLHNPTDIYFDYLELDMTSAPEDAEKDWVATFSGPECTDYNTKPCGGIDGTPPALSIETDGDEFVVTGTAGSLDNWRDRLVGIKGSTDLGPPRHIYDVYLEKPEFAGDKINAFVLSGYWTGPMPAEHGGTCRFLAESSKNDSMLEEVQEIRDFETSDREEKRDRILLVETQLESLPQKVECDPFVDLRPPTYEMPPIPDELQLVGVGSEIIVPDAVELAPDLPSKALRHDTPLDIPAGPRFIAARGTFDEGDWGEVEGKDWWFISWGHEKVWCDSFQAGRLAPGISGWGCSEEPPGFGHSDEVMGGSTLNPGGGTVLSFIYGTLSPEVATVEFELTTGELVRVDAIEAPGELKGGIKYYAAYLPPAENGYIVARGPTGEELQRERICPQACITGDEEAVNGTISH